MRGCDYIAKYFKRRGVKHFFGYQGGAITPLIDSMHLEGIEFIQSCHEQASGFTAEAYTRISEDITLAIATNGPGVTNFISAIANAYLDSTPCLFITGQVNTTDIKTKFVRQNGFQEVDTINIVKSITKYANTVLRGEDIEYELDKAIDIANSGRKGAVLLDFPLDVLIGEVDEKSFKQYLSEEENIPLNYREKDVFEIINNAERPLVLLGGGVRLAGVERELNIFLEKTHIPSVSTLMGQDCFSSTNIGLSGLYGHTYANLAILSSDVLLVLGSRLSKRQFGKDLNAYSPNAKIIHIDIDSNEISHVTKPFLSVNGDLREFLCRLTVQSKFIDCDKWRTKINKWRSKINKWKIKYNNDIYVNEGNDPVKIIEEIAKNTPLDTIITTDVGQNQMWVAQGWILKEGQRILTSGGLGCMGFSLPAATGAIIAKPNKNVIAFMGDGGFQMNIQELQTIVQHNLPIKIVVFNNKSLGMIAEMQHKYMGDRYFGSMIGYGCPNLEKIANAYGIKYVKYQNNWTDIISQSDGVLVEVELNQLPTSVLIRYDKSDIYKKEIFND